MKRLRAAVAGAGLVGPVHVEALRRLGIEVTGILGITKEEGRTVAERLNLDHYYSTFDELCADSRVDVVHICTPNYAHYPMARSALLAGKHVVCEKPLTIQSAEARELARLAHSKGLVGAVCFNMRYYPQIQEARSRVHYGEIGQVHILRGDSALDWLCQPSDWNWRLDPELGGPLRAIADFGSHWLDMLTWITGLRVTAVMADFATFIPVRYKPREEIHLYHESPEFTGKSDPVQMSSDDYAAVLLMYEGGAHGSLTVSQVSPGHKDLFRWEINGSLASLAWESETPNQLWIGHREHPNEILVKEPTLLHPEARGMAAFHSGHVEGYPDTFTQLFRDVYTYIDAGDPTLQPGFPTFEDGWRNLALLERIARSAEEKRWVEVKYEEL